MKVGGIRPDARSSDMLIATIRLRLFSFLHRVKCGTRPPGLPDLPFGKTRAADRSARARAAQPTRCAAVGLGGQRIFVVPALDLVAIVNAGLYHSPMQAWVPLIVLNRYVLAAMH